MTHAPQHPQSIQTAEAADDLCQRLSTTLNELVELLDRETALIRDAKTTDLAMLQIKKSALTAAYTRDVSLFRANAEAVRSLATDSIARLQDGQEGFRAILNSNRDALATARSVSQSIVGKIGEAAAKAAGSPDTYGRNAAMAPPPGKSAAIAFDRKL